jgi:hypothetical protein
VLIAPAFSLMDAARAAQVAAPAVHLSGVPGRREPGGGFAQTPQRMRVPVPQHVNEFGHTKPAAACRGVAQELRLYFYDSAAAALPNAAASGRRARGCAESGVLQQRSWLAA